MGNNFTFTYKDIKDLANTHAKKITVLDLVNDTQYQETKKRIESENKVHENMVATIKAMNNNKISDEDAKVLAEKMGCVFVDIKEFEDKYIEQLQADADQEAKEKAYEDAKKSYDEFIKVMGFNNNQPQQFPVINMNAVIQPQVEDEEIDEAHMTFSERCEYIECLVSGSAKGNTQLKKHLDTRHKNIGAKSLVKEWYKKGYISLAEKNSLLFMCNISTCSNHLNVTARR
jgi:hypothetical protein